MSQVLVCNSCKQPLVFTGAVIELVGESRIGCKHRCGPMNELRYLDTDEKRRSARAAYFAGAEACRRCWDAFEGVSWSPNNKGE